MSGHLEITDLTTAYDKTDVLHGVSLTIQPGRITCLLGSNGSGKTTLIRSILGLTPPRAGRIAFDGMDITALATHKVIAAGIACIPEGRGVFPKLTVEENLRLGAYQESSDLVTKERLAEIYQLFPRLAERRLQLAGTMSGGEQAMISIGRGLMRAPKLLLVDEPSLGLSPLLVKENFKIIHRIHERGITVFLVEQNVHQTLAISHYGYVLSKGRVVASGSSAELVHRQDVHEAYFGLGANGIRARLSSEHSTRVTGKPEIMPRTGLRSILCPKLCPRAGTVVGYLPPNCSTRPSAARMSLRSRSHNHWQIASARWDHQGPVGERSRVHRLRKPVRTMVFSCGRPQKPPRGQNSPRRSFCTCQFPGNPVIWESMSSVAPVPPPPPAPERLRRSSRSRRRHSFWRKLSRRRDFRQVVSNAALWALTVVAVWVILKQIIK